MAKTATKVAKAKPKEVAAEATKVNKAKAVREYMEKHPEAKPKAVAEAVSAETKVKVNANYVSIIKSSLKKTTGKKSPKGKGVGNLTKAACLYLRAAGDTKTAITELERVAEIIDAMKA